MKKIILLCSIFLWMGVASAKNLNYNSSSISQTYLKTPSTRELFYIYENNENQKLIFTTSPDYLPSYEVDYQEGIMNWEKLDIDSQNQIRHYLEITQNYTDYRRSYAYIIVQNYIWSLFQNEKTWELEVTDPLSQFYLDEIEQELKQNQSVTPDFIKDYEIEESLTIENVKDYEFRSQTCLITEQEDAIIIKDCEENSQIEVIEKNKQELKTYETGDQNVLLEAGESPKYWQFLIHVLKKEPIPTEPEKEVIPPKEESIPESQEKESPKEEQANKKEEEKEEIKGETTPQKEEQPEEIYTVTVPNTSEQMPWLLLIFIFLGLCKWRN